MFLQGLLLVCPHCVYSHSVSCEDANYIVDKETSFYKVVSFRPLCVNILLSFYHLCLPFNDTQSCLYSSCFMCDRSQLVLPSRPSSPAPDSLCTTDWAGEYPVLQGRGLGGSETMPLPCLQGRDSGVVLSTLCPYRSGGQGRVPHIVV